MCIHHFEQGAIAASKITTVPENVILLPLHLVELLRVAALRALYASMVARFAASQGPAEVWLVLTKL